MNSKASSSLIIIFFVMSSSFIIFYIWINSSIFLSLNIERERFYKNFYLAEILMNYAVNYSKDNFDGIVNSKNTILKLDLATYFDKIKYQLKRYEFDLKKYSPYFLLIREEGVSNKINIYLNLYSTSFNNSLSLNSKKSIRYFLACTLKRIEINEQAESKKDKFLFIIKNYTISPIV